MIRAIRAELVKARRRSVLIGGGIVLPVLAVVATIVVFANATTRPPFGDGAQFSPDLAQLGSAGGLTRGFTAAAGLSGLLVLVVFITSMTSEWGTGTFRVLFTREPRRIRVVAGKVIALLLLTIASLVLALVASAVTAYAMAGIRGIPTSSWLSATGIGHSAGDWGRAVLSVTCYGLVGLTLGALIRSTTVAVAVAFAWFFPFEHILQNSWSGAGRWFPGLLFDAIATDGNSVTSFGRALALGAVVAAIASAIGFVDIRRRDITA